MAKTKKNFTSGIDAYFTPSIVDSDYQIETTNQPSSPSLPASNDTEQIQLISLRIPVPLKIKLELYCVNNRMKQKDAILKAIRNLVQEPLL